MELGEVVARVASSSGRPSRPGIEAAERPGVRPAGVFGLIELGPDPEGPPARLQGRGAPRQGPRPAGSSWLGPPSGSTSSAAHDVAGCRSAWSTSAPEGRVGCGADAPSAPACRALELADGVGDGEGGFAGIVFTRWRPDLPATA